MKVWLVSMMVVWRDNSRDDLMVVLSVVLLVVVLVVLMVDQKELYTLCYKM